VSGRPRRPSRLGVFGGTFDPPHLGHLLVAEAAREVLYLDRVLFVPARVPPHKVGRRVTDARVRLEMLRAALRGSGFRIETLELDRPGPSFTVDTLRALHSRDPRAELFLVVGADSLRDLPLWREPRAILDEATLAVARRPGSPAAARLPAGFRGRLRRLQGPAVDIASSDLRARVARGASIRFQVPAAVERIVRARGLYRA